ncbi:rCG22639, isoform CRA_a [Rattus norvegicus]|uniref:RCG22639, isoform CRA_a n=1 Tax=Rattus norvegicus TaxID=10116 RepID=A6KNQ9_RAT|nr:rCG22639, isoform CRA_a [Rattus norvegicus]
MCVWEPEDNLKCFSSGVNHFFFQTRSLSCWLVLSSSITSLYVIKDNIELCILLPPLPKHWDCSHTSLHLQYLQYAVCTGSRSTPGPSSSTSLDYVYVVSPYQAAVSLYKKQFVPPRPSIHMDYMPAC